MLVRHYEWAGYDVLAITDHWVRTVEPSTRKLLVIPSTELNARRRRERRCARARPRRRGRPGAARTAFAPLADVVGLDPENGGVPYLAHTYWSGLRTEQWWDCEGLLGIEVWNTGCELELGRGDSSIHWDEALEHGRALFALATDDSHHPGYDSGFAWTMGARGGALAGGGARRTAQRPLLRLDRPGDPRRRDHDDDERRRALLPAQSVTLVLRPPSRRARERRPARLSERVDDPRARLGGPDHGVQARAAAARAVRPRRGAATPTGRKAWTNPLWTTRSGARAARVARVRPARDRRRDHRRRHRRGGDRRTGSTVALVDKGDFARRDVERVVEADPRRPALPAARRRRPRARGAPRAPRADERRRAAPRRAGCRSCSRCTRTGRTGRGSCRAGSSSTRRSRARG